MKGAKQCALWLRREDYGKRIREGKRPELVRLLAELVIQALKSEGTDQGGTPWKR